LLVADQVAHTHPTAGAADAGHADGTGAASATAAKPGEPPRRTVMSSAEPRHGREMIAVDRLSKIYGKGDTALAALDDISMTVREGRFVTIVGPSGCGKSTLLQILAGLVMPSTGRVVVEGKPVTGPSPDKIGVMFQDAWLLPWKTAVENIEFPLALRRSPRAERRKRALPLLDLVGLRQFADRYPDELSGGMRQRVALARALAQDSQLLLMDEPFAALDALTRRTCQDELLQLWEETKFTVLFVTHSIAEAIKIGNRILLLSPHPGRVKAEITDVDQVSSEDGSAGRLEHQIHDLLFSNADKEAAAAH